MKNNLPFYQHYSNSDQHPKFKMLRVEFGWSGEGKFWALNNRIAQADNCCLDVSKKYNKAAIASDLSLSLKEFDSFINFLLHDCELIMECEPGVITTDIVQENFDRVSKDRASARERSRKRWGNSTVSSPEKDKSSPEHLSKVKESKVKERKGNKELSPEIYDFTDHFIDFVSKENPNIKKANREKSAEAVEKLIRIDNYPLVYIRKVLGWAVKDDFWSCQVFSLAPLRQKSKNTLSKFQNIATGYEKENGNSFFGASDLETETKEDIENELRKALS